MVNRGLLQRYVMKNNPPPALYLDDTVKYVSVVITISAVHTEVFHCLGASKNHRTENTSYNKYLTV